MKKISIILIISMLLILFTSCVPEPVPLPYGVWKSENPDIILYLKDHHVILQSEIHPQHVGIYIRNDEKLRIFPTTGNAQWLYIRYNLGLSPEGRHTDTILVSGVWSLVDDQMHYRLFRESQERLGVRQIIFNQVEYYEPIDLADWITPELELLIEDHARRAGEWQERMANQEQISSDE